MSAPWRIRIGVGKARDAYARGRKICFARKILSLSQFFVPFILTPLVHAIRERHEHEGLVSSLAPYITEITIDDLEPEA